MRRWFASHPRTLLVLLTLGTLVPFLGKPFNMDDPLFVWTAKHIQTHPGNPYGFGVNWFGTTTPMWEATKNPPLACYYLALGGSVLGWSEIAIHTILLLPALAAVLGTYRLACRFCQQPAVAGSLTLFTPVFLVSSSTAMCDIPMIALWLWALVFWIEGTEQNSVWRLAVAAILISLAILTKYFAITLIGLVAAYSFIAKRRLGSWILCVLIPVLVLVAYGLVTHALYGKVLLLDAAEYTKAPLGIYEFVTEKAGSVFTALTFTGGGLAVATFLAPLLWRGRALTVLCGATVLFGLTLLCSGALLKEYGPIQGSSRWWIEFQMLMWAVGGVCVLALTLADVRERKDASSWLLTLWVLGTFLFSAVINWTVNGRSLLPIAPALGILIVRRLERKPDAVRKFLSRTTVIAISAGAALALLVTGADFSFAQAVRTTARQTYEKYGHGSQRFWFQGHWGFQYYMEQLGATALDRDRTELRSEDIIAVPENNTNLLPLRPELVSVLEVVIVPGPAFVATAKGQVGASFYASIRGPLPFAFGAVPPELVAVLALRPPAIPPKEN